MRASQFEDVQASLFKLLAAIHNGEGRSGSHDDTGAGADIYANGKWYSISPKDKTVSYTSVQNSSLDQYEISDDYEEFLAAYRAWVLETKANPYPPYNVEAQRRCHPSELTFIEKAIVAGGSYHYGSSVRGRFTVEAWRSKRGNAGNYYEVLHLEHVGAGWGSAQEFLKVHPDTLFFLAELDALKEYKK